jgi:hypothetical protein
MALPELPTNWLDVFTGKLLGLWQGQSAGVDLKDSNGNYPNVPILNAVTPLEMAYNKDQARFDLSIEPTALIPSVPTNRTAFVDAANGSDLTGELGERTFPFRTIAAALLAVVTDPVPPSAANPALVLVWPGIYDEDPLMLPSWVTLASADGAGTAIVQATAATSPLLTVNPSTIAKGLTFRGADGIGGVGIASTAAVTAPDWRPLIDSCVVQNCTVGISCSGTGAQAFLRLCEAKRGAGEVMDCAYQAKDEALLLGRFCNAEGVPTAFLGQGVCCDNAELLLAELFCTLCTDGLLVTNGGSVVTSSSEFLACVNAVRIAAPGGVIDVGPSSIQQSLAEDVLVESSSGTLSLNNVIMERTPNIAAGATVFGPRLDRTTEEVVLEGSLRAGAPLRPASAAFGSGGIHVQGMIALQNDNLTVGTWTDVTESLASATGSEIAVFPANQVDACLFIGGDAPFPGLQLATTLAKSGTVAAEYWNGAAWVAIPRWMTTLAAAPRTSTALALLDAVGRHNMRFSAMPAWATTTLDGNLKYWVRLRITGAPLTTVPRLEQVLLHSNHTRVGPDGVVEHFGDARPLWAPELDLNLWQTGAGSAPTSATVSYSPLVSRGGLRTFTNAVQRSTGYDLLIPRGLDTSEPLTVTVEAYSSNADVGTVEMRLSYVRVPPGSLLTGALAGEQTVAVIQAAPGVAGQTMILTFTLPLPTWIAGSDRLAMTLTRLSTDAHTGDVIASKITAAGRRWRD